MGRIQRTFRTIGAGVAAGAATLLLGWSAQATSPVTIDDTVVDPEGFLSSSQHDQIDEAARDAASKGLDMYVVLVPDLSGAAGVEWCQTAGKDSGLSSSSIVYVIAYEERSHSSCGNEGEQVVSDSDLTRAMSAAEDVLAESNPLTASATTEAAVAFVSTAADAAGSASSSTGTSNMWSGLIALFFILGIGALIVILVMNGARKNSRRLAAATARDAAIAAANVDLANRRLLEADEMVRSAADELEFARAQFGQTRTDAYAAALAAAQETVRQGFAFQQEIVDARTDAARGAAASKILASLDQAMPALVAQQREFAALRDSEAGAAQQIADVRTRIDEAAASIATAEAELVSLSALYPATTISSLLDNPEQARALLASATEAVDRAASIVDTDAANALVAVDTARRALAMAQHQVAAVINAKTDLDRVQESLTSAIASITSDLSDVTRLGADQTAFAPLVADATAAVDAGRRARSGEADPLGALESLRLAEAALDAALESLRTAEEARRKQESNARTQIQDATAAVQRAQAFVQGRRGAIDLDVRSVLSQAEAALAQANAAVSSDPAAAISHATNARAFANQVLSTPLHQQTNSSASASNRTTTGSTLGDALLWSVLLGGNRNSGGHSGGFGGGGHSGGFGGGRSSGFGGGHSGGFGGGRTSKF